MSTPKIMSHGYDNVRNASVLRWSDGTVTTVTEQAAKVVEAAGEAGGIDYVRKLASTEWSDVELDSGNAALRAAIKAEAARVVAEEDAR